MTDVKDILSPCCVLWVKDQGLLPSHICPGEEPVSTEYPQL